MAVALYECDFYHIPSKSYVSTFDILQFAF